MSKYLPPEKIAQAMQLTVRHVRRLAEEEHWLQQGKKYALESILPHHPELSEHFSQNQKTAWEQATKDSQDTAIKRFGIVQRVREIQKHAPRKDRKSLIIKTAEDVSYRTITRWVGDADKALNKARREGLNPQQTQLEALLPGWGQTKGKQFSFDECKRRPKSVPVGG